MVIVSCVDSVKVIHRIPSPSRSRVGSILSWRTAVSLPYPLDEAHPSNQKVIQFYDAILDPFLAIASNHLVNIYKVLFLHS